MNETPTPILGVDQLLPVRRVPAAHGESLDGLPAVRGAREKGVSSLLLREFAPEKRLSLGLKDGRNNPICPVIVPGGFAQSEPLHQLRDVGAPVDPPARRDAIMKGFIVRLTGP
jgi:hypothetical protein